MLLKLIKPLDTPTIGLCEFSNCSNHKKQKKTYLLGQIGFKPDKTYCDPDTKEAEENLSLCIDCIAKLIKKPPGKHIINILFL